MEKKGGQRPSLWQALEGPILRQAHSAREHGAYPRLRRSRQCCPADRRTDGIRHTLLFSSQIHFSKSFQARRGNSRRGDRNAISGISMRNAEPENPQQSLATLNTIAKPR